MKIIKYFSLLILICVFIFIYSVSMNFASSNVYHSFYPIGGGRTLVNYLAATLGLIMPMMLGVLLGFVRCLHLFKSPKAWSFNWYCFLIIVFPMFLITLPEILINYLSFDEVIPISIFINKLFPHSEAEYIYYFRQTIPVIAGFSFSCCFSKKT